MKTTDRLLAAAAEIWEGYHKHPFVKGICDGTLDREKFKYYIIQDYFYLIDYARVFALAAAKSPGTEEMKVFVDSAKFILDNEMNIHDGYMGKLELKESDLTDTPMSLDNSSYVAYMLRVAYEETAPAICASILACAYSYEVIAKAMIAENPASADHEFYGDWIRGYASEEYAEDNRVLIEMTDALTEGISEKDYEHIEKIFVDCSRFEAAFWDMAWEMR